MKWLHQLESCASTNTYAIENRGDLHHGDVVFTCRQTAGRGQHGRTWYSPEGVLTASFVLDGTVISKLSGLSLGVGLAVIYTVEDLVPDVREKLLLKWPNDVMCDGRKLAGILCESSNNRVVVGIGLNRCVDFAQVDLKGDHLNKAISLHQICDRLPEELALLTRLRHYLLQVSDMFSRESASLDLLIPELKKRDFLLNKQVVMDLAGNLITSEAVGIDSWGRLLLRLDNGEIRAFASLRLISWQ